MAARNRANRSTLMTRKVVKSLRDPRTCVKVVVKPLTRNQRQNGVEGEQDMTKGPNGEKRPADAIGCAVMVARIATGEERDTEYVSKNRRNSGVAGAKARANSLVAERRSEIATHAAKTRWNEGEKEMDMSGSAALRALLSDGGRELVNFKFLAGTGRNLCEDDMCGEAARVIRSAIDDGMPHCPPTSGRDKVKL